MIDNKTLTEPMLELLSAMVKGRLNLIISGGTGAGKTTVLNVLSGYIPNSERIVTIEDAAELQLKQEHVVRLETRPPNIEGKGSVRMRQLVINSLRMRPDRIVVGEVRGEEAFDMLQAMNTGHEGSLTTVHANSPRDALARIENMVSMANLNIPERAIRHQIANAVHAVVQVARLSDGSRKVITVSEITGMENDMITLQDVFVFERSGIDESGKVRGVFHSTGNRRNSPNDSRPPDAVSAPRSSNPGWRFSRCSSLPSWCFRSRHHGRIRGHVAIGPAQGPVPRPARSPLHRSETDRNKPRPTWLCCATKCSAGSPPSTRFLRRSERVSALQKMLAQGNVNVRAGNFLMLCVVSALVLAVIAYFAGGNMLFAWVGALLGFLFPTPTPPTCAPSASRNLRRSFPKPSTPWPAPSAPDTPSPPPSK